MSAAIQRDERFGRLGPAAVGLLAPMLEADPSGDPAGFADSFAAAFERCAGVADSLGLRSLNYLFPLVAPYLREQSRAGAWRAVIERLEPWVCDLVALCAGELDPDQAVELVEALPGWPEFPRIPERFLNLIEARLREDAQRLTAGAHGALGASGDGVPVVDVALPPALALEVQTEPITVARDELALLLEATAALSAQLDARAPMAPMSQAGAEDVGERLRALAGALGHVGLSALAQALAALGALPATPRPLAWPAALAAALHRYFSDPDPASAGALVAQLGAPEAWLRFDPESLDALQRQLAWPRLLASRRVDAGVRRVQPADLSLDIPPDADAAVIDHLRRELPALSAQFSSSVDSILEGSVEALGEARRIAHTLKGSAITVGVRGVATLTHQLEDLLQLLDESRRRPPPLLGVALAEAADCLSQMTDAVAGHGDAPHDALTVCELLADWVHRLVSAPHASHEPDLSDLSDLSGEPERLRAPEHGPPPEPERAHAPEHAPEPPLAPAHERPPQHAPAHAPAHAPPHAPPHAPEPAPEPAPDRAREHAPERAPERAPEHEHAPHEREGAAHAAADDATVAAGREKPSTDLAGAPGADATAAQPATAARAEETAPSGPRAADEEPAMRVPESLVERMLDLAGEAAIVLAQVQEQLRELGQTRHGVRDTAERLSQLGAELERVVDSRSVTLDVRATSREFDPLELDAFDELHTLTRRIAEVGADDKLLDRQLERQLATMNDSVGRLERVQTDLREAVVRSRMVPVGSIAARLQRAVRQAARIAGKSVAFELAGEEVGVDAQLLQSLVDPLTHLLRNAVDHGIEDPRTRLAAGKPEIGRVSLEFSRQGQNLSIACRDDGRGLDYDAIGARATELGLRPAQGSGEPGELANLILRPGFSTRRAATELSGRGIGLDVVASAVARLRGTLRVESAPGQGVSIGLAVPERIASLPVMVVRAGARVLALSIRGIESVGPAQTVPDAQDGAQTFWHEGAQLEVVRLDRALGLAAGSLQPGAQPGRALASAAPQEAPSEEVALIVARDDGARIVVVAPQASQPRSVVMRPLPAWFPRLPSIDGATVLGDGAVAAVIDLPSLLARGGAAVAAPEELAPPRLGPRCLVADDSVSVRRAMEAFLHDLGLEVDSASDGVEALEHFDRQAPDLAILDLEMPRMNGLELAGAIRERVAGKDVPLIMITSRSSDKHRAMARAAGVDVFMTKPYTEDDLASAIRQCLERGAPLG